MKTDVMGNTAPDDEPLDKVIGVWQVTPHPGRKDCGHYVERSWQAMTEYVKSQLETFIENELYGETTGLVAKLEFKIITMTVEEYQEILAGVHEDCR